MSLKKKIRISKEQWLCLLAATVLSAAAYYMQSSDSFIKDGVIERSGYGGIDKSYSVVVDGLPDGESEIEISVSHQMYTEKEALERFDRIMEELSLHVAGENEDLSHVMYDLRLPKSIPGHEGIKLSYSPADPELISYDGAVNNIRLKEKKDSEIRVKLKTGDYSKEYVLPVTVYPKPLSEREKLLLELKEKIEEADMQQGDRESLKLPDRIEGAPVVYSQKKQNTSWLILLLGITAFVIIGLKPESDKKKAKKLRDTELAIDYSELISKLIVYIGAGLTVRNAWIKITESYKDDRSSEKESRALYEEMVTTAKELENGLPERKAYMDFAHRCGAKCYIRLASLLEQNRKTGDSGLIAALQLEMEEAFEQRKNTAKRLGEEAGTKLIFPLMISLVTVIVIIAVPALLTMK